MDDCYKKRLKSRNIFKNGNKRKVWLKHFVASSSEDDFSFLMLRRFGMIHFLSASIFVKIKRDFFMRKFWTVLREKTKPTENESGMRKSACACVWVYADERERERERERKREREATTRHQLSYKSAIIMKRGQHESFFVVIFNFTLEE